MELLGTLCMCVCGCARMRVCVLGSELIKDGDP